VARYNITYIIFSYTFLKIILIVNFYLGIVF
jgi:hypothetical protein